MPFTAIYLVPFYLMGDVKLGVVAAEMIIGVCLFQFSRRWSLLAAGLFLLVPLTYYTDNATFPAAFLAISLALEPRGRRALASVSFGVALATSLFVWLAIPFFAYRDARRGDARSLVIALITVFAISLPFFAAGPSDFIYDVLFFQFGRASPGLVTTGGPFGPTLNPSLSGFATTLVGQPAPLYLRVGITLAILAVLLLARVRRAVGTSARDITSSMLLRSSAFAAAAVLLVPAVFFFAYVELPLVLLLCWLAML
jgi:uncharacterized membrane protein